MNQPNYLFSRGQHPHTSHLGQLLSHAGCRSPITEKPYSEAMLLGLSGGLGNAYIMWEFKKQGTPIMVLSFNYRFNYPKEGLTLAATRAGSQPEFYETGGAKTAAKTLKTEMQKGRPAMVWVAPVDLPYLQMNPEKHNCWGDTITVFAHDEHRDEFLVHDMAEKPFRVPVDAMAKARARVGSFKHRFMVVTSGTPPNPAESIKEAIGDCVQYLGANSTSFALPVIRKWARMMTDNKNAKGWPTLFQTGRGLYRCLLNVHENIEGAGLERGALRPLYADFLAESMEALPSSALSEARDRYLELGKLWNDLAETALSDEVPAFKEAKRLLRQRASVHREKGGEGLAERGELSRALDQLDNSYLNQCPLNKTQRQDLFSSMGKKLFDLYEKENQALTVLKNI